MQRKHSDVVRHSVSEVDKRYNIVHKSILQWMLLQLKSSSNSIVDESGESLQAPKGPQRDDCNRTGMPREENNIIIE